MNRYTVAGDELRAHYPQGTKLSQVFQDIERELAIEEKVVCRYILNGVVVPEADEGRVAEMFLVEIHTLEYLSEDKDLLMRQVIQGWLEAIPELTTKIDGFAAALRRGEARNIMGGLTELVDNCQFLMESLWSIQEFMREIPSFVFAERDKLEKKTKTTLREIIFSLEKKDFLQLADLIEYDLNNDLECWRRVLLSFADRVGALSRAQGAESISDANSLDSKRSSH